MNRLLFGTAATFILACAIPSKGPSSVSESTTEQGAQFSANVDAVIPSGRNLFVFDFSQSRYQKWALSQGPDDSLSACRILDTLQADWAAHSNWLTLPSPSQPFTPMQAFWGPSGNFFLIDRSGKRITQHDSGGQLLSSFPLPQEIRERNMDRFEIFWTRDGVFSFVDLGDGTVRQYTELRSLGGQGDWRIRNTIRLPLGLETCLWEPYFRDPCCIQGKNSRKGVGFPQGICFDKYFNELGAWVGKSQMQELRPELAPSASGWSLHLDGGAVCGSHKPACFSPEKKIFSTCPEESDSALSR